MLKQGQFAHGIDVVKLCSALSLLEEEGSAAKDPDILTVDEFLRRCEVKILRAQRTKK